MATWSDFIANAYSDIGTTYQQVMLHGTGIYPQRPASPQPSQSVNPEYTQMQTAYDAQETEREHIEGITEASYMPSDFDYEDYGRYLDAMEASAPPPEQQPDQDYQMEMER